jgi:hypothetical protein
MMNNPIFPSEEMTDEKDCYSSGSRPSIGRFWYRYRLVGRSHGF